MTEIINNFCLFDSLGNIVGVVPPSTFFAMDGSKTVINGPTGVIKLNEQTMPALTEGLQRAGALVEGNPVEVEAVCNLLQNPETSRTASFFLCKARNCSSVIEDFESIKSANVLLVGCGGIGSSVALLLAGCGIRKLTLVDPDIIEKSNLNRQLFWRKKDIGQSKVHILKREINDRFEHLKIRTINKELSFEDIVNLSKSAAYSTVIITADSPPTLVPRAEELASILKTPVLSGGYLHSNCVANFFSGKDNEATHYHQDTTMHWNKLPHSIMPSFGPLNFNIAALLASAAITFTASKTFDNRRSSYIEWDAANVPSEFITKYYYE